MQNTLTNKTKSAGFASFDIAKFIIAAVLTFSHAYPELDKTPLWYCIFSTSFPVFFFISGFFIYRKVYGSDGVNAAPLWAAAVKSLKLYGIWTAIYLPVAVYDFHRNGYGIKRAAFTYIKNVVFMGKNAFSWQLWYLLSTFVAFALLYVLVKRKLKLKYICIIASAVFVLSFVFMFLGNRADVLHGFAHTLFNLYGKCFGDSKIFCGFAYIAFGMLACRHYYDKSNINLKIWIPVFVLSVACKAVLTAPFNHIITLPAAFALFLIIEKIELPSRPLFADMRYASAVIYFSHIAFIALYVIVIRRNPDLHGWDVAVFCLACSLAFSAFTVKMRKMGKLKFLTSLF